MTNEEIKKVYEASEKVFSAMSNLHDVAEEIGEETFNEIASERYPFAMDLLENIHEIIAWQESILSKQVPIGEYIRSYEWIYTGGNIWVIVGQLNDGNWFNSEDLDVGGESFQIFKTFEDAMESWYETVIREVIPSNSAEDKKMYAEMWKEILHNEEETNGEMSERVADWKNELIDILAEA